ncbi:MAG TPA: pseudouridine synthase [Candidatus Izemoplasmatales bacterium]|nr:pseudouridine synthase [Candidatus Izemoplasmatales bacterium]
MERIQKIIAASGAASRRTAEEWILQGRVKVNGETISRPGHPVEPSDRIEIDGRPLPAPEEKVYFLLNKPAGVVTTTADDKNRKTVVDLIDTDKRIFPVGRLDYDTTGALILTNDGDFMNALIHPRHHVEKEYSVKVEGLLRKEESARIGRGLDVEDFHTLPCRILSVRYDQAKTSTSLKIIIEEGKYHQIKRMFEIVGHPVIKLSRIRFGTLTCEGLSPGEYRRLKPHEIKQLWNLSRFGNPER